MSPLGCGAIRGDVDPQGPTGVLSCLVFLVIVTNQALGKQASLPLFSLDRHVEKWGQLSVLRVKGSALEATIDQKRGLSNYSLAVSRLTKPNVGKT